MCVCVCMACGGTVGIKEADERKHLCVCSLFSSFVVVVVFVVLVDCMCV